jgi:putative transposase
VELSDNLMIESRVDYIHLNPVRAGIVEQEHEYIYSSAKAFAEMPCILDVDEL